MAEADLIPVERIARLILLIREHKIILGNDLASMYGVETRVLIQSVKRNLKRFPDDFMFQLTWDEVDELSRSQFVILKRGKNIKFAPYAFTEQGVAMLSSVLNSDRAVEVNIAIMRAFVQLRQILATHKDLAHKLKALERKLGEHDDQFTVVFEAIRQMMNPPQRSAKRRIGFCQE